MHSTSKSHKTRVEWQGKAKGAIILLIGAKYTNETTTIMGAWGREWAGGPHCTLYDTMLFRVSSPGRGVGCSGGWSLALGPVSGAAPGWDAPAHAADRRAPLATAPARLPVSAFAGGCGQCVLCHLRRWIAPADVGRRSHDGWDVRSACLESLPRLWSHPRPARSTGLPLSGSTVGACGGPDRVPRPPQGFSEIGKEHVSCAAWVVLCWP